MLAERDGDRLCIRFNRPTRHNAFSTGARAALLDALDVARLDPSVTEVVLTGNDVNDAGVTWDQNQTTYVTLEFKPRGGQVFCDVCSGIDGPE